MTRRRTCTTQPSPPIGSGWRQRPLVLVVDDTVDNREMYMEYLEFVGFRVAGAADGENAIALARELRPSVVLMDLSLPGVDGWEATRRLKADPATRSIPVIAITGHVERGHQALALRAGCDRVISKPSLPADVARHIVELLDATRARSKGG